MEKKMEQGKLGQRASVPAFGQWDGMKAAGVLPDYSLDFSKIRAIRMQRKEAPSWSSAGSAQEVAGGDEPRQHSSAADADRDRRHCRHHSEADVRRPLRPDRAAPKVRSKFKGSLLGCMGGW